MMLDYILSKESIYRFERFKSGEDCLKNMHYKPDVVILDYNLPGMSGYDILLELKRQNPRLHVIMLTSNKDKKLAEELIKAGADDCINKQGHGERQVIEKLYALLEKEPQQEPLKWYQKLFSPSYSYIFLMVLLLILGMLYYS
jgi:DNA-binding NarL/FixJ family response regulator